MELAKRRRSQALSNFTRSNNTFNSLIEDSAPSSLVTPQFNKVNTCWENLEKAHDDFIELAEDIDIDTDAQGCSFLNKHGETHTTTLKRYSTFVKNEIEAGRSSAERKAGEDRLLEEERKKREAQELKDVKEELKEEVDRKFESAKTEFISIVESFERMNLNITDSLTDASNEIMRAEWQRIETEFQFLKDKLSETIQIDHTQDASEINQKFIDKAEKVFLKTQKWMLSKLKDSSATSGGSSASGRSTDYSTKKEPVRLPSFKGDEKMAPFLQFPVWKKQWDVLIDEYEEKWRSGLLWEHVDESARGKFVGYETDYKEAMDRLDKYFGDPLKVVSCVMRLVMSHSPINDGDYGELISYSVVLESNFNRLKSVSLEHEMSNTSAMSGILRKFPRSVAEKWYEFLSGKSTEEKGKPFPTFITWLNSQKEMWERMAATEVMKGKKGINSYYGDGFDDPVNTGKAKRCFSCGEVGHFIRSCPRRSTRDQRENGRKPRKRPVVKKFWCALHQGDPSKACYSNSCQELRRMEVNKRVKLLKDNGDCIHCCGDHKPADCQRKERVCGGDKKDRGCAKSHNVHELFCLEAKVFTMQVHSMGVDHDDSEGVILSIMQVKGEKKRVVASVFWDLGCTSNFVREDFAKSCGFKGQRQNLSITTLGGVTSDMSVVNYRCSLRDVNGNVEYFDAYGMETITGNLTKINPYNMRELFPHLSEEVIQLLQRRDHVDFLVGMSHPSWHPERVEKAKTGGDFWLYRGRFGVCVGGRFPGMREGTRKSKSLFSVNKAFHITSHSLPTMPHQSHEFEYCANRIAGYEGSDVLSDLVEPVVDSNVDLIAVPVEGSDVLSDLVEPVVDSNIDLIAVPVVGSDILSDLVDPVVDSNVDAVPVFNLDASAIPWLPRGYSDPDFIGDGVRTGDGVTCYGMKTSVLNDEQLFFESQSLGTVVEPRCGGCKCTKCPIPGSVFSFKEQREFDIINKNLFRVEGVDEWYTEYPWRCPRSVLPKNDKIAFQNLVNLERNLGKNPELADDFCQQIDDMVARRAAIILSEEDLVAWDANGGDYYYLPMVGVKGKKKWLRVCFDASRKQGGYPCLNDCLHKGPDRFVNNLLSVILGFRNGRVGAAADISKFHNKVRLVEKDIHMQRFLWRKMRKDIAPSIYAMICNNFGVKPANCIATSALHQSADVFADKYPTESQELKDQTYVDDELVAGVDKKAVMLKTQRMDEITAHAGMPNKGWTFSGDTDTSNVSIGGEGDELEEKVLGLLWTPISDMFNFRVVLRFKVGSADVDVTCAEDFDGILPSLVLTRRTVLANVSRIFDPAGLLCPIILESKLLMRASWCGSIVGWDDPIPEDLASRWVTFLRSLLKLADVKFPRSLWPEEEVVGLPLLIVFSDGAALAFGAAAYIRWELKGGGFWTRLIMAKCKIAPKDMVSIPRMELNGAVIGNRIRNFLLKETSLKFSKVYQFVDSSTVLGYVQKESGHFKPYEGVRVAEIQSSNKLEDGELLGWAWVSTDVNPSDWCTKPRSVEDLVVGGFWESGPDFLRTEESSWPIKRSYKKENLEGELQVSKKVFSVQVTTFSDILNRLVNRGSSWKRMIRVLAWMLRVCQGQNSSCLNAREVKVAKWKLIKFAQKELEVQLKEASDKGTGRFRKLAPVLDQEGVWRVGSRLRNFVPFTFDAKLPAILPPDSRLTLLIMQESHQFAHTGQDGTLSRFRSRGFWTLRGGHLAKKVKKNCVPCRKTNPEKLKQPMGEIPSERLKDPVAWGWCQMDLFGPFHCRGDVNPRTTKKTWGIIMEDVNSGAVHLDIVQDYSTPALLLTMRRFGALRGWPGMICTDPGSQLESASGKLESWWSSMENSLRELGTSKNFQWRVSPPDSPWRQGKAERRIAIVKRLIKFSIGDSRVTPLELQTILMEIANICNERPIGLSKPRDDGTYDLITPNHLLLGRSGSILPDDAEIASSLPMSARYRLVHHVTTAFWKKWCIVASPSLVIRQKWHQKSRNLCVGDLVTICDSSPIKAKYKLGVVDDVHPSADGCVRSATVRYVLVQKNTRGDDKIKNIHVKRSVQRLSLILPVEEQSSRLEVEDHECSSIVKAGV